MKKQYVDESALLEREALIAFYKATDGDNWTNNTNWCTDADITTWYGISVRDRHVVSMNLYKNNLSGTLPEEIGDLQYLFEIMLSSNNLTGHLSDKFYSLLNLNSVYNRTGTGRSFC